MGNFVPHLSHHTEPLRAMLKQDAVFAWDEVANTSFQKIKDLIAKSATKSLWYYDRRKPVTVQADASQRGLGTCLLQEGEPITYASKSLTDTETRYANIERELLAIVFACQQFNTYVLGRPFTVESDHKPLEMNCHRLHMPMGFLRPGVAKLKATTNSFSVHTSFIENDTFWHFWHIHG